MVTFWIDPTATVGTVNGITVAPAGTGTDVATGTKALFDTATVMFGPPVGAALPRYTVPVTELPPITVYWFNRKPLNPIGYIVNEACALPPPKLAVTLGVTCVDTLSAVAFTVTVVAPVGTGTLAGICNADGFGFVSDTKIPAGAGPLRSTVSWTVPPAVMLEG
jgi:hypothetical protein